jgi:hypothetical protein
MDCPSGKTKAGALRTAQAEGKNTTFASIVEQKNHKVL